MANINLKKLALVALAAVSATTLFGEVKERFFAYRSFFAEFEAMKNFGGVGVNTITIMPSNTTNSLGEPYCQYPVFWRERENNLHCRPQLRAVAYAHNVVRTHVRLG